MAAAGPVIDKSTPTLICAAAWVLATANAKNKTVWNLDI